MKDLIVSVGAYIAILGALVTLIKNVIDIVKALKNGNRKDN